MIFWFFVIVFGLSFGLSTWAKSNATAEALHKLQELSGETGAAQKQLESLIRTLPPEGFLRAHEKYYEISVQAATEVMGGNNATVR